MPLPQVLVTAMTHGPCAGPMATLSGNSARQSVVISGTRSIGLGPGFGRPGHTRCGGSLGLLLSLRLRCDIGRDALSSSLEMADGTPRRNPPLRRPIWQALAAASLCQTSKGRWRWTPTSARQACPARADGGTLWPPTGRRRKRQAVLDASALVWRATGGTVSAAGGPVAKVCGLGALRSLPGARERGRPGPCRRQQRDSRRCLSGTGRRGRCRSTACRIRPG